MDFDVRVSLITRLDENGQPVRREVTVVVSESNDDAGKAAALARKMLEPRVLEVTPRWRQEELDLPDNVAPLPGI